MKIHSCHVNRRDSQHHRTTNWKTTLCGLTIQQPPMLGITMVWNECEECLAKEKKAASK